MRPWGYDLADAQAFLDTLSAAGQAHYMGIQHKLDLAYPVLLGVTLVLGVQLVYARPFSTILAVIALGGSAADFLENAMVRGMLNQHGGELDAGLVSMASFFTVTKSVLHTIALCALLWGGARALWRRVM